MNKNKLYREMGLRIRDCRKRENLTQEQLAEIMDVTPQMISNAENGTKGVRPENIVKFSRALDVSCDYLLTGKGGVSDFETIVEYSDNIGRDNMDSVIKLLRSIQRLNKPDDEE